MRSAIILTSVLLALLAAVPARSAGEQVERVDQLKAAYLINFVKFVEWPPAALSDAVTICFIGGKGLHDALVVGSESKRIGSRRVFVRELQPPAGVEGCNVLYREAPISAATRMPAENVLPILTVSDAEGFVHQGGMIQFFTKSNRLRFNINVDSARKAGLHISSSLLQLAAVVEKGA
jgi:hypothetical protein